MCKCNTCNRTKTICDTPCDYCSQATPLVHLPAPCTSGCTDTFDFSCIDISTPITIGDTTFPAGTFFFHVFNKLIKEQSTSLDPPPHDDCLNAITITEGESVAVSTFGATSSNPTVVGTTKTATADVWYYVEDSETISEFTYTDPTLLYGSDATFAIEIYETCSSAVYDSTIGLIDAPIFPTPINVPPTGGFYVRVVSFDNSFITTELVFLNQPA